jgi:hypothetical protein
VAHNTSSKNKPEVPTLPVWITIPLGFALAFFLGEYFDFAWWQRFASVVAVSLLVEGINQLVRRMLSVKSGKVN